MTVKEFKNFIIDCEDNDIITICADSRDNPVSDCYDVGLAYKIQDNNSDTIKICLMPK